MSTQPESKETIYISGLIRESILLTDKLSKINKKIEFDLNSHKSALVKWYENNGVAQFLAGKIGDKAGEKSLEPIIKGILTLTRASGAIAEFAASKGPGIVIGLLVPAHSMNEREAYIDDHADIAFEYYKLIDRLDAINRELYAYLPPSNYSQLSIQKDRCAEEACLRN